MTKEEYINLSEKDINTKAYITIVKLVNIRGQVIQKGSEVKVIKKYGPYGSTMEGITIKDTHGVISEAFIEHVEEII